MNIWQTCVITLGSCTAALAGLGSSNVTMFLPLLSLSIRVDFCCESYECRKRNDIECRGDYRLGDYQFILCMITKKKEAMREMCNSNKGVKKNLNRIQFREQSETHESEFNPRTYATKASTWN